MPAVALHGGCYQSSLFQSPLPHLPWCFFGHLNTGFGVALGFGLGAALVAAAFGETVGVGVAGGVAVGGAVGVTVGVGLGAGAAARCAVRRSDSTRARAARMRTARSLGTRPVSTAVPRSLRSVAAAGGAAGERGGGARAGT